MRCSLDCLPASYLHLESPARFPSGMEIGDWKPKSETSTINGYVCIHFFPSRVERQPSFMKLPELRGILQYVTRFRDKIFVIAVDGEILASDNFPNILLDIAVLRSLNIKVVLVHGAGSQIERTAVEHDIAISNSDGSG